MLGFLAMLEAQNHPSLLAFLGGVTSCLALSLKKLEFCGSLPTFSATEMGEYAYYPAYVPSMTLCKQLSQKCCSASPCSGSAMATAGGGLPLPRIRFEPGDCTCRRKFWVVILIVTLLILLLLTIITMIE